LCIRESRPVAIFNPRFIPGALFFATMIIIVSFAVHFILGVVLAILIFTIFIRKQRAGTFVSINLQKKIYFVCNPSGCWGGGWPPDIALRIEEDSSRTQWITSLYLASVCIWTAVTPTAAAGRRKITPFVGALRKIAASKRTVSVGFFDVMLEMFII
jgi:hypothetical protein